MLSKEELIRYQKHLLLPEIGIEGQEKLKAAKVLVVGAGGLGCPALQYLTAAGIGQIGIVDDDVVEWSNLQRQILYNASELGQAKAELAAKKLRLQNPEIRIDPVRERLSTKNAERILSGYDIVLDGSDNFPTRYLLNDICFLLKKTLISGALFKFEGQVAVFDLRKSDSPTYRCLFPLPPTADLTKDCSETGIIGVLPGIIGSFMALETIKQIIELGKTSSGNLFLFNSLDLNTQTLEFDFCPESLKVMPGTISEFEKMDYQFFCNSEESIVKADEISADGLSEILAKKECVQFLDVREIFEEPQVPELNDLKIPLWMLEENIHKISRESKVIVICKSGARSQKAIELLETKYKMTNLVNLRGGLNAWIEKRKEQV